MKKSFLLIMLTFIVSFFYVTNSSAQLEFPEDKVSWDFTVTQDGENAIIIGTITMVEHWHIYAVKLPADSYLIPTDVVLEKSSAYKAIGGVIEPKPYFEHDDLADEDLFYHSNTIILKRKIKVFSETDFTLKGVFSFQTCDDTHCLPPHEANFEVKVKGVKKEVIEETTSEVDFSKIQGDETKNDAGEVFVKVNNDWYKVPVGNSTAFYKKYLSLGGKHEE